MQDVSCAENLSRVSKISTERNSERNRVRYHLLRPKFLVAVVAVASLA